MNDTIAEELKRLERELRRERDFVASLVDTARALILAVDPLGRIVRANAFAASLAGRPAAELVGQNAVDVFFAPEVRAAAESLFRTSRRAPEGSTSALPLVTGAGDRREIAWYRSPVPDPSSSGLLLLLIGHDVTERERLFREVERLSTLDPLTGLSNRRHFDDTARMEVMRANRFGRPLAAVMLDIDHFKEVNDRHGHQVGDQVLRAVSGLCLENARKTDLKARYGGEEFCMLLAETGPEEAAGVAERLRAGVSELGVLDRGEPVLVTASLGVAGHGGGEPLDSLLFRADHALYAAKGAGRNRVVLAA